MSGRFPKRDVGHELAIDNLRLALDGEYLLFAGEVVPELFDKGDSAGWKGSVVSCFNLVNETSQLVLRSAKWAVVFNRYRCSSGEEPSIQQILSAAHATTIGTLFTSCERRLWVGALGQLALGVGSEVLASGLRHFVLLGCRL